MKILLTAINAKYIHSNLAIYSLKAASGEYSKNIELAEYTINNRADDILADIFNRKPDVLCFSCYIWNIEYVEKICREFKKISPETPVWLGGPEVSYEVNDFLAKHPEVNGIIIGEGEITFKELCGLYLNGNASEEALRCTPGLAFSGNGGEIIITENRKAADMSDLPFSYDTMEDFTNKIVYYDSVKLLLVGNK